MSDTDTEPAYGVARYLAVERVDSPTFTPTGRLLFLADTSGTPQVWTTNEPGAWPERLTPHEERVSTVAASPTDEAFVFGMDRGSDERDQLFHYDLDTGVETALTADHESKHAWGAWGPDGERIAYTANRDEDGRFDAYVQRVGADGDPDRPERVHEGPGGWLDVEAFGPRGERVVLSKPRSSYDAELSLLDLASGEVTTFSDGAEATYSHVHFDGEGGLYCITDHGSDTAYVGRVDFDTGEIEKVAGGNGNRSGGPGTDAWDVDALAYDHDTGRAVFARNENGYSAIRAGTVDGTEFKPTDAPDADGIASGFTLGPDAERAAFTHTAPTEPYGVRIAEWGATEAIDWAPVGTNGIPKGSFRAPETVHYETFDGREIPAYWTVPEPAPSDAGEVDDPSRQTDAGEVVTPAGASADAPAPVIVDIHGGPEHQRRPWFSPTKQFFLERGYAVLEPNVRGSSGYGKAYAHLDDVEQRMDSVADVAAAVGWLEGRPEVDSDRVVAYGRSYGGFMVLAAITEYPDLWAAAVDFVGIADFTTFLENTGEWRRSHREAEYGSLEDDYDFLTSISPLSHVENVQCPLFVQHGANDPRVPVGEAEQVVEAVRARGVPVRKLIFEDEGHHTTSRENLITEFEAIAEFLDEHV